MAVKAPQPRTRRIPLVLFLLYGLFALLIASLLLLRSGVGRSTIGALFPGAVPTATGVVTSGPPPPTPTSDFTTPLPLTPTSGPQAGAPTPTPQASATGFTSEPPTPDNPFGLPLWVFQALFGVTAVSGLASIVRWVAGAASAVAKIVARK